ncbi:ATP-binding protein [Delftia sp. UME58]|uniref:sensor histidine kinase n=1 Tax=Delftia sp. UME58 TaxID=1862322 RepID=UPI0016015420|nr:ATP-binding protein [Delftia sp. UME58]MBB1651893.1 PAS domain-containing sensor histidine kinase [Delftia sp. UME58]
MSKQTAAHHFLEARRSAHLKVLVLTFALCVLSGLVLFVWSQLHAEADQSNAQAALLARVLEDQTGKTFETGEVALASLAHNPVIQSAASPRDAREAAMAQVVAQLPVLRSMALLDGEGRILASTQAGETGLQIEVQKLLPDKASAPVLGKVQLGRLVTGRSLSSLASAPHATPRGVHYLPQVLAFEHDDGAPAVLVALINPDAVANFYQTTLEALSYEAVLLSYDGQPLASTNAGGGVQTASARQTPIFQKWLPGSEFGSYIGAGLLGPHEIVSFRTVRNWPLLLVVEEPYSEVIARWRDDAFAFFGAGLALLALVLGLSASVLKTRRVQRSAQQAMEKAQARIARSEHEMAVLMRSVQELIFRTDSNGRLTFVNARWEQWTGQPSVEAVGQPLEGIVHEACRPQIQALLDPLAKLALRNCQARFRLPDDREILCDIAVVPLLRDGRLVGFAGSAVDVTARWKAQQELQTQLAFQHLLFETTPLPMLVTDADQRVALVNKAWEDFFGRGRYAVLGHEIKGLHSLDDALLQMRSNQVVLRSGQRMVLEARLPHVDGSYRDVQISKAAVKDAQGRITGVLSIFVDVSEFRAAEHATREARDAAEEAFRVKSEFVANMSHELRTPLQSIMGFAELGGLRSRGNAAMADMFNDIHAAGQRMLALVNDLLDVAKLESAVGTIHLERTDLRSLIRPVVRELEPQQQQKLIDLRLELDEAPLIAKADPVRFQQVVRNVLANAIKFSPIGGRIDVQGRIDGRGDICIAISDQGPGIPPQELDKIFQPFVQSSKTKNGSGGTGLGLAICRKIIDTMDGTIVASNGPAGGAMFCITLPTRNAMETRPAELT